LPRFVLVFTVFFIKIRMNHRSSVLLFIGLLFTSTAIGSKSSDKTDHLPQSIVELKRIYEVVEILEKRGVLTEEQAQREKQVYIEYGTKLVGTEKILTTEEFLSSDRRESIISFSNVVAVLAGVTVFIAGSMLIGIFVLPRMAVIPVDVWRNILYFLAFSFMFLNSHSWLVFLGCLIFLTALSLTFQLHRTRHRRNKNIQVMSWILFAVWSAAALYQQNREAGYLAIMALESALGFVVIQGELITAIGFEDEKLIPSSTLSSLCLVLIGSFLHMTCINVFTIPFTRPLLFIGTFVYFIGLIILSSRLYYNKHNNQDLFWLLQGVSFLSGLLSMLFGPLFGIPFIQAVGGTMFVFWLLEKYAELMSWRDVSSIAVNLFGFGIVMYGAAYFLRAFPENFIFSSFASK
jgi:hypothetical protein